MPTKTMPYTVRALVNTRRSFGFGFSGRHWGWRGDHRGPSPVAMRLSHIWHELCSFTTERSITFVDWRLVRARPRLGFPEAFVFSAGPNPASAIEPRPRETPNARVGRDTETAH